MSRLAALVEFLLFVLSCVPKTPVVSESSGFSKRLWCGGKVGRRKARVFSCCLWLKETKPGKRTIRSLLVLTFTLSMVACGDGDRRPKNQSANPLYPSGPEQAQRGQIMTVEGSSMSKAEVVIIDAERLVVLARAPVDNQGNFEVSVPQRPSYWLGVSGPYMATYVDTAFVFTGEAITINETPAYPVDELARGSDVDQGQTVDEIPRSHPAGKLVENGVSPLLGDVDGDQTVDGDDALVLFAYLLNGTVPPGGNIQLGDVNADGQTDWTDLALLGGFLTAEQDGTNPLGIGEPVPPASLPPAPEGSAASDKAALEAFYDAPRTNRNNPRGLLSEGNWKSEAPLDEWVYVQTNSDGRVISLRISPSKSGWLPFKRICTCFNFERSELSDITLQRNRIGA